MKIPLLVSLFGIFLYGFIYIHQAHKLCIAVNKSFMFSKVNIQSNKYNNGGYHGDDDHGRGWWQ